MKFHDDRQARRPDPQQVRGTHGGKPGASDKRTGPYNKPAPLSPRQQLINERETEHDRIEAKFGKLVLSAAKANAFYRKAAASGAKEDAMAYYDVKLEDEIRKEIVRLGLAGDMDMKGQATLLRYMQGLALDCENSQIQPGAIMSLRHAVTGIERKVGKDTPDPYGVLVHMATAYFKTANELPARIAGINSALAQLGGRPLDFRTGAASTIRFAVEAAIPAAIKAAEENGLPSKATQLRKLASALKGDYGWAFPRPAAVPVAAKPPEAPAPEPKAEEPTMLDDALAGLRVAVDNSQFPPHAAPAEPKPVAAAPATPAAVIAEDKDGPMTDLGDVELGAWGEDPRD